MERFLTLYQDRIQGVLHGFDRLLFRGIQRSICFPGGLEKFFVHLGVLRNDFEPYNGKLAKRIKDHARDMAKRLRRPYQYVAEPSVNKEKIALEFLRQQPIQEGLICVLACQELGQSFDLRQSRTIPGRKELYSRQRACVHLYFYYLDREFGLMHVRLQTWLPFPIQVCVNGREYLAQQMKKAGIGFEQRDNSFSRIDDLPKAQELLKQLETRSWVGVLNRYARRVMPLLGKKAKPWLRPYYWTTRQGEYATDVMFQDEASLAEIYPHLVDHAIRYFSSLDVMRFLGRRTNRRFSGEVITDRDVRLEGVCVKHRVEENSIKMYDKQGCILRIETTINQPRRFRVRRTVTRKGRRLVVWASMRKGVMDMARRAQVSRAANLRYLEALAGVTRPQPVHRILDAVGQAKVQKGRRYRALKPCSAAEAKLYQRILEGRFQVHGFRNADLHDLFTRARSTPKQIRGKASRWLRLQRAHGIVRKVPHTHLYRLSKKGIELITTALQLRAFDAQRLAS